MSLFGAFTLLARSTRLTSNAQHLSSRSCFSRCYTPAVATRAPSWATVLQSLRISNNRRLVASKARTRPDKDSRGSSRDSREPPNNRVIYGILGLNGVVFLAWQKARSDLSYGDYALTKWLRENFTVSLRNIQEGRVWTLLNACFSHEGVGHIIMNIFTFYFMSPPVLQLLGTSGFLALYLGGGLVSSVCSLVFNSYIMPKPNYSSHGASGAMFSVISFLACVAPTLRFHLWGILPVPAWLCVSGLFLYDAFSAMNNMQAGTDTAGHVGGILGGIGFYLAKRLRIL